MNYFEMNLFSQLMAFFRKVTSMPPTTCGGCPTTRSGSLSSPQLKVFSHAGEEMTGDDSGPVEVS